MYRKGPKPNPPKGCLWIEQAAEHVGASIYSLRRWRLIEYGPVSFKVGGYVAYKVADLDAYLDGQYQAAITPDPEQEHNSRPAEARAAA
ncbi:hypothetical protein OG601_46890 [Streptomyces sp. NBC_01239]|jgi:hypothetical protein|uniref:hypothetical protein n=1 Tax=Streptomyces sp. NBC_01239 TaxID=2903792 RepID=UPI002256BCD4|nr:hypothetical protein [Streptomyces sp. NBC_01239]MCX4809082.1 hypothetical protein [Streptomyces sp. NBC_01239]MCX4818101.1 hypothetical protein [Streptomyces sp. NBC_01239]